MGNPRRLFVTGAGGFLGTPLVEKLRASGRSVAGLYLCNPPRAVEATEACGALEPVMGDLLEPRGYAEALAGSDAVLHLAAATGNAPSKEQFRINERGTRVLVEQCRRSGPRRFLFVSTIAVKFPDKRRYPYAEAKTRAEEAVGASGLSFSVVRPTIIVGREAPVLAGLQKLAGLPLIPVFGSGKARVQPIWVEDLADLLVRILNEDRFDGETLELGGPETLTIEELLVRIRRATRGSGARTVHLPLGLILRLLGAAESMGLERLPVTCGQLSSFRFDGTIEPNSLHDSRRGALKTVDQMLASSLSP